MNSRSNKSVFRFRQSVKASLSMPVALMALKSRLPIRYSPSPLICGSRYGVCCMRSGRVRDSRLWCRGCRRRRGLGSRLGIWAGCYIVGCRRSIWYRCDERTGLWSRFRSRIRFDVVRACNWGRRLRVCTWNTCNLGTRGWRADTLKVRRKLCQIRALTRVPGSPVYVSFYPLYHPQKNTYPSSPGVSWDMATLSPMFPSALPDVGAP